MEALSTLEDRLSTKAAFILLGCAAFAVTGIGLAVLLNKVTRRRMGSQGRQEEGDFCAAIKDMLMGSLRWSGPSKWKERGSRRGSEGRPLPLLAMEGYGAEIIGWQSHNSESPVWQRPILMGEKCELPRFSGLILYDEQGRPLSDSCEEIAHQQQVRSLHSQLSFEVRKFSLK